jgi:hypothetical protein
MLQNILSMALFAGVAFSLTGCGGAAKDAPSTVAASGTITFNGKPVPKASVAFTSDKGKAVMGETDDQGHFTLTTNEPGDGAPVGEYKVTLVPIPDEVPDMFAAPGEKKPSDSPFPAKYSDPTLTDLTATVTTDSSKNVFNFDLK